MKIKEAKKLEYRQVIYDSRFSNADGSPIRWRVNGKVKLWKRNANRIYIPLKHGLYDYGTIEYSDLPYVHLTEKEALEARLGRDKIWERMENKAQGGVDGDPCDDSYNPCDGCEPEGGPQQCAKCNPEQFY